MASEQVRAGSDWLALREPADAAARSTELVDALVPHLPGHLSRGDLVVHDLGCGTGSMTRWLAPRLPARQRWVLHDRDADLLAEAALAPPPLSSTGAEVTVETRQEDITLLDPAELAGADLITASALLDMMTAADLDRFVGACARAGCPVLITLTVVGRVELSPADPADPEIVAAFNAHQRRDLGAGPLLGPTAATAAATAFAERGLDVRTRPSPWRLGADHSALIGAWLAGWLGAATEQRPELRDPAASSARRRREQIAAGSLAVTVHHRDLLVLPRRS